MLFPEEADTTLERLYQDSPTFVQMNALVQKAISGLLKHLPQERRVRILEIGAGTGGTTVRLLPHLNPQQTEYALTDIGRLFIARMRQKFADYPFVHYQVLDIEKSPQQQGFASHHYDLIIAANVLHATRDLRTTLQHIRQLLVPGGMLVLLEGTAPRRWIDLIFGLLKGWWMFSDYDLRPNYPLLSAFKWQEFLQQNGFTEVSTIQPGFEDLFSQAVIVAQAPITPEAIAKAKNSLTLSSNGDNSHSFKPSPAPHLTIAEITAANPQDRHQLMESYLAKQVARVLEISHSKLDLHAPLKNLGLDSLMAIEVKSKIEVHLGKIVPPVNTLPDISLEQLTKQMLAKAIPSLSPHETIAEQHCNSHSEELIAIQPCGFQPPFICVHPGALDVSCYGDLASHLGNERPFYALKPSDIDNYKSLEDRLFSPTPIEEVAAHCLEILHSLKPEGPYFLGGWSLGGCASKMKKARKLLC
ncbi:methyltransferase [Microseira wollei]|uniref:Beta-ketoacyl synthase n=1 Tax=Microseira wollei NIES-4236 TaxID=2530354 RepID=A0AAV3XBS9_9CYAN|nr:methyltransferase [Microseira wollei]GET39290.1 beta-ketoacyl synthase [Microseira wollei NIES-4236]